MTQPVAFINVEQRKLEWARPMNWHTPTVANLPKIPLYQRGEHMKARQVFTALMSAKGYTDEDMKMDKGRYTNAAMQGRWSYFLAGWEMRGVM